MSMRRKVATVALALAAVFSLAGCSQSVHEFLNPPSFTPPAAVTPTTLTPLPTYIEPGSVIQRFGLHQGAPRTLTFTSFSTGFTVKLACKPGTEVRFTTEVKISGATSSHKGMCSSAETSVLKLGTPLATDGQGIPVSLTLSLSGPSGSTATGTVLNGSE